MPESQKDEFMWIQLRKDVDENFKAETGSQKLLRKFKETPLVPIGVVATTACLCVGLYSMVKMNSRLSQLMMRARVVAQGFTVVAFVVGFAYSAKHLGSAQGDGKQS